MLENIKMGQMLALLVSLLFSVSSWALTYGFIDVDPNTYKVQKGTEISIADMPAIRSQDTAGLCYAFAAATIIDTANCQAEKISCAQMSQKNKVSTFDLSKYTVDVEGAKVAKISSIGGLGGGGDVALTIGNSMFDVEHVANEECIPFDQIVAKPGNPKEAQELQLQAWNRLKQTFDVYKAQFAQCQACAADFASTASDGIKQDFNIKASNADILKAFSASTFSKFLERLVIPRECLTTDQLVGLAKPQILGGFPPDGKSNYLSDIAKIKEVLGKHHPIAINGYCADEKKPPTMQACEGPHAFVVSGYRKVCNPKNQCRELLKVQNSWGQAWQDAHNDGWLDAKEILDRTYYDPVSLTWLEPKPD